MSRIKIQNVNLPLVQWYFEFWSSSIICVLPFIFQFLKELIYALCFIVTFIGRHRVECGHSILPGIGTTPIRILNPHFCLDCFKVRGAWPAQLK